MIAIAPVSSPTDQAPAWHARFLAILPAIREQARFAFRQMSPYLREEWIDEVAVNALVAYARLVELGREDLARPTPLAGYGIAQVRYGRRVGGSLNSRDVLSRYAQQKNGFHVERLDRQDQKTGQWAEAVVEDYRTPVPDQAAFRIDFPAWLSMQTDRDRQIAEALAMGERSKEVARRYRVSPGRISQIRRSLHDSWQALHGEPA